MVLQMATRNGTE